MNRFTESLESRRLMSASASLDLGLANVTVSTGDNSSAGSDLTTGMLSSIASSALSKLSTVATTVNTKTAAQRAGLEALSSDVTSAASNVQTPSAATLQQFHSDALAIFSDRKIAASQVKTLVADTKAILASEGVSKAEATKVTNDMKDVISNGGLSFSSLKTYGDDLVHSIDAM